MPILLIVLLSLTVNYFLILGAGGLCRQTPSLGRALLGASTAALHILLCMLPRLAFMRHTAWHLAVVPIMGVLAFGWRNFRLLGTLLVLCLGLDAVVSDTGVMGTLAGICVVVLLWLLIRGRSGGDKIPVQLYYKDRRVRVTALRDTGNCLRDPITGETVLVISGKAAEELTGLTEKQLKEPLETIGFLPGLRLIPYKAVGSSGFLLGMRLPEVKIGGWQGSHMVAFAPMGLEGKQGFEALIGGYV